MNQVSDWKVPKWPFISAFVALCAAAELIVLKSALPISNVVIGAVAGCFAFGAMLMCLPFVLEYRAVKKLVEVNAVAGVAEQLQDLGKYATQVAAATDQWARVQETTQGGAEKAAAAARDIAERMAKEVRDFNEFQSRMNDSEKAALRLETEKLRRIEGDWLQVVARILDHVFALHNAAVRSGQPELVDQIGNFQHACRDSARRVGLVPFGAEPGEKFDAQKHRVHGAENPDGDALIAELLAPGLTFQGRLLRPALVKLQEIAPVPAPAAEPEPAVETPEAPAPAAAQNELTLEAD